jgi:hypothetical protein
MLRYLQLSLLFLVFRVRKTREEQVWADVLLELGTALVHLPALREVRVLACQWPTTECVSF